MRHVEMLSHTVFLKRPSLTLGTCLGVLFSSFYLALRLLLPPSDVSHFDLRLPSPHLSTYHNPVFDIPCLTHHFISSNYLTSLTLAFDFPRFTLTLFSRPHLSRKQGRTEERFRSTMNNRRITIRTLWMKQSWRLATK